MADSDFAPPLQDQARQEVVSSSSGTGLTTIKNNGTVVNAAARAILDFVPGVGITISAVDSSGGDSVTLTLTNAAQDLLTTAGDLLYGSAADVFARLGIGATAGTPLRVTSGLPAWTAAATAQSSPADPTGTSSTVGLMMGLAGSITPIGTRILVIISGDIQNTANDAASLVQTRYGTGTAPTNGAALTGTAIGGKQKALPKSSAAPVPFSCQAIVTGLTAATAYWLDTALVVVNSPGTGTASIKNVSVTAVDV